MSLLGTQKIEKEALSSFLRLRNGERSWQEPRMVSLI
jgi:hypothetical protein